MRRRGFLVVGTVAATSGCITPDWADPDGGHAQAASGPIELVIDGETYDLSQERFQAEHADASSIRFHLHEGDDRWHMEGDEPVTVGEGLDLLPAVGFEPVADGYRLDLPEASYGADSGDAIDVRVDGESVDPFASELTDDEAIHVEVSTA